MSFTFLFNDYSKIKLFPFSANFCRDFSGMINNFVFNCISPTHSGPTFVLLTDLIG